MAKDDNDAVPLPPALVQPPAHERRANALPLELRQDGHRREGQGRDGAGLGDDRRVAEEDVADNLPVLLGDQRHLDVAAVPQGVHETGLVALAEGEAVDVSDGVEVCVGLSPDRQAHGFGPPALAPLPLNHDSSPSNTCAIDRECSLPKSIQFDSSRGSQPRGSRSIW